MRVAGKAQQKLSPQPVRPVVAFRTFRGRRLRWKRIHPGVTHAKSFVFGVDGGSTPAIGRRGVRQIGIERTQSMIATGAATAMEFEQFYLGCLAHASYLLGS